MAKLTRSQVNGLFQAVIRQAFGRNWAAYHADCVIGMRGLPDNSAAFNFHSPPFLALYIYSDSIADLGNTESEEEFFTGYRFSIAEQYRVCQPGRFVAVHCKDTMRYMSSHGYAGLYDFPGQIIQNFQAEGFLFKRWITVWKDPVIEMQRTKTYGLLHKSFKERAEVTRQGCADYVLIFQKPYQAGPLNIVAETMPQLPASVFERIRHQWSQEGETIGLNCFAPHLSVWSKPLSYYDGEFIEELSRETEGGRLAVVHCCHLPVIGPDGLTCKFDMPGEAIRRFESQGSWKFHSRCALTDGTCLVVFRNWTPEFKRNYQELNGVVSHNLKAPRIQRYRYQANDRRLYSYDANRVVHPDYVGNQPPMNWHDDGYYSILVWQKYASPVWFDLDGLPESSPDCWMDIDQTDVLNARLVRNEEGEKHICLARGSLVLTRNKGYVPIEEIFPGDQVLTHRGDWKPVTYVRCNGVHPVVKIKAQGVANLRLTPKHRLWFRSPVGSKAYFGEKEAAIKSNPEWVSAKDTEGGYINLKLPPEEESYLTADEWWAVGRWLGDGHIDTRGNYHISCSYDEKDYLLRKLGIFAGHVADTGTSNQIAIRDANRRLRGVLRECGSKACEKQVPVSGLMLCQEKAEALLSGYLSADGHYAEKYDRYTSSSVSRALLLGMAMVAQRARGVVASVYAGRKEGRSIIQGRTVNTKQDWVFAFRNSEGYKKSGFILDDGAWKKVREIEIVEEKEQVWDIQVEGDESFTAEGCIVHNCPLQLGLVGRLIEEHTVPGEIVMEPYLGIGSVIVEAVKRGRKGIGFELKGQYFEQATKYLWEAEAASQQISYLDEPVMAGVEV